MAYQVALKDGYFEVRIRGESSKFEVLAAIRELDRRDRGKSLPDLWLFDSASDIPLAQFGEIIEATASIFPPDGPAKRTALVASDAFQAAEMEMYRLEAVACLPFEIRVFLSQEDALAWIKSPE